MQYVDGRERVKAVVVIDEVGEGKWCWEVLELVKVLVDTDKRDIVRGSWVSCCNIDIVVGAVY